MSYHKLAPLTILAKFRNQERSQLEPDDPEENVLDECACCGEPIYIGDDFYESKDGEYRFHEDCIKLKY